MLSTHAHAVAIARSVRTGVGATESEGHTGERRHARASVASIALEAVDALTAALDALSMARALVRAAGSPLVASDPTPARRTQAGALAAVIHLRREALSVARTARRTLGQLTARALPTHSAMATPVDALTPKVATSRARQHFLALPPSVPLTALAPSAIMGVPWLKLARAASRAAELATGRKAHARAMRFVRPAELGDALALTAARLRLAVVLTCAMAAAIVGTFGCGRNELATGASVTGNAAADAARVAKATARAAERARIRCAA